ncbi:MAG: hypothetical protein EU551_01455, partial [Promethearchaeota archaeon]
MPRTVKLDDEKHTDLLNIQVELKRLTGEKYPLMTILASIIENFRENNSILNLAKRLEPSFKKTLKIPQDLDELLNLEKSLSKESVKRLKEIQIKLESFKNFLIKFNQEILSNKIQNLLTKIHAIIPKLNLRIGLKVNKMGATKSEPENKIKMLKQAYIIDYFVSEDCDSILNELNLMNDYLLNQNFVFFSESYHIINELIGNIEHAKSLREDLRSNKTFLESVGKEIDNTIKKTIMGRELFDDLKIKKIERSIQAIINQKENNEDHNPLLLTSLYNQIKDQNPNLNFSLDDLEKVVNKLVNKKIIQDYETYDNIKLIRLLPYDLSKDQTNLINIV